MRWVRKKSARRVRYAHLQFADLPTRELRVMDMTAVTLCRENRMLVQVPNLHQPDNLVQMVLGDPVGTIVRDHPDGARDRTRTTVSVIGNVAHVL